MKHTSILIEKEQYQALEEIAKLDKRSIGFLIREAIEEFISNRQKQITKKK